MSKTRIRRTDDQMIADLLKEIERIKSRAQTRKAKKSPELKATTDAVRSIDTALRTVQDGELKKALVEAREPLVAYLQMEDIPIPKRRGRKPKDKVVTPAPRKGTRSASRQEEPVGAA